MSLFKRKCSLEEFSAVCLELIRRNIATVEEDLKKRMSNSQVDLRLEIIVLNLFWARTAIMDSLADYRPAIDALHLAFLKTVMDANAKMTGKELASIEEFINQRISEYVRVYNEGVEEGTGNSMSKVGFQFGRFIGLSNFDLLHAHLGAATCAGFIRRSLVEFFKLFRIVLN